MDKLMERLERLSIAIGQLNPSTAASSAAAMQKGNKSALLCVFRKDKGLKGIRVTNPRLNQTTRYVTQTLMRFENGKG